MKTFMEELYEEAVKRVDPFQMIRDRVRYEDGSVYISDGEGDVRISLSGINRILFTGAGKASAPMARAMEMVFEECATAMEGLVAVKYGHTAHTDFIRLKEAGHPIPDEHSVLAAREICSLLETADKNTLVFNLISGGGSSLLARPYPGIAYEQYQEMVRVLLECGADIQELNTLRKHASGIKGGRLAEIAHPATLVNVLLSDVVGDDPGIIASGPGVPDSGSFQDVWKVIRKYQIEHELPEQIINHFRRGLEGKVPETPKPGAALFSKVRTVILGNNRASLNAAAEFASRQGVRSLILTSRMTGEAREMAKFFAAMAMDPPDTNLVIMAGGETTVTIRGRGKGGRNQELALSYLYEMIRGGESALMHRPWFLAAGSDGNDGPTDAAGAIIGPDEISSLSEGPDIQPYLSQNNSYQYLAEQDLLYKTGPTNTNVCDFCFLYIPR